MTWLLALLALALALVSMGVTWNLISLQGWRLRRDLRKLGLSEELVELGDAHLHVYASEPAERTVLLLHGFGGEAAWQWPEQVRALRADGYRVVLPNLLWFGRSSSPRREFSVDRQADVVVQLLDSLGIDRADVAGISYGGIVGWVLAARHPERVQRLVLVDAPGPEHTDDDYAAFLERFSITDPSELLVPSQPESVTKLLDLAYSKPPPLPRFLARQIVADMYGTDREEKVALLDDLAGNRDALRAAVPSVDAPTLLVWGEHDPVFPLDIGRRLADRLGCSLVVIPDAKHAPQLEHPRAVSEALLGFLREARD